MTTVGPTIGVHDLLRRRGSRLVVNATVDLGGAETSTASIPDGTEVSAEVTLDSINDGIVLTSELNVPWSGECRRCLEMTSGTVRVDVHEVYRVDPVDEMLPIVNEEIDVGGALRDAAVLSLPIAPLCSDDCRGPLPSEFPVMTAADESAEVVDPRWAALSELRFDSADDSD